MKLQRCPRAIGPIAEIAIIFVGVTIYNVAFDVKTELWAEFWHLFAWLILSLGILTTVWFTCGGLIDLSRMFRRLSTLVRDDTDDGTVEHKKD